MTKLKDITEETGLKNKTIWGPLHVYHLMTGKEIHICAKKAETVYLICLDSHDCLKKVFKLNMSTSTHLGASSFKFIRSIIQCGSRRVILVHNHPNGNSSPSFTDMKFTRKINRALRCCGITLLDHIIIGNKTCSSIARLLNPKASLALFMNAKEIMSLRQDIVYYWLDSWHKN